MLKRTSIILACALAVFQAAAVQAQTYPARDITFIVPWNAGGSNDVAARALDPILREHGIKIVIENVVGATGTIGMRRVATAAPDGYTIGMGTSSTLALIAQARIIELILSIVVSSRFVVCYNKHREAVNRPLTNGICAMPRAAIASFR